jgi:LPXTG-motif cell wall-anchored protein
LENKWYLPIFLFISIIVLALHPLSIASAKPITLSDKQVQIHSHSDKESGKKEKMVQEGKKVLKVEKKDKLIQEGKIVIKVEKKEKQKKQKDEINQKHQKEQINQKHQKEQINQKHQKEQIKQKQHIHQKALMKQKDHMKQSKQTQIHLHLQQCSRNVARVFVQWKGEWKELSQPGQSPLFKTLDKGQYVRDDITAFQLVMVSGGKVVVPVNELRIGVEANGTINYWLTCSKPDRPGIEAPQVKDTEKQPPKNDATKPPKKDNTKPPKNEAIKPPKNETTKPAKDKTTHPSKNEAKYPPKNQAVNPPIKEDLTNPSTNNQKSPEVPVTTPPPSKNDREETAVPSGSLPKTGEDSQSVYYVLGALLLLIGAVLLGWKKLRKR